MLKAWRKTMDLLDASERRSFRRLMVLVVLMGFANMIGVGAVIPFLSVLADPGATERDGVIGQIYRAGGFETTIGFQAALGVFVLVVFLGSVAIRALCVWALARFGAMRIYTIQARILRGYLGQPYIWYLGRHSSDLMKTVLNETAVMVQGTLNPLLNLC